MPTGDHFYCTDPEERDVFIRQEGYQDEGIACYVHSTVPPEYPANYLVPLWRLFHPTTGDHFYTADFNEADQAVKKYGYTYEQLTNTTLSNYGLFNGGYALYNAHVWIHESFPPGTPKRIPFYRALHSSNGDHFYTTSSAEWETACNQYGYLKEGIACYVYDTQLPGTEPLFRLLKVDDPPFPADPDSGPRLAEHTAAWSSLRDSRILPGGVNVIQLAIEPLSPPSRPSVGAEAEFWFAAGKGITWWKECRLYDANDRPWKEDIFPADPAGQGIAIMNSPDFPPVLVGRFPISELNGAKFVFSKAGAFSVHVGAHELRLGDAQFFRGKKVTFKWVKD